MRYILSITFVTTCLLVIFCRTAETIVGSERDTLIKTLTFTVDTTNSDTGNNRIVAKESVKNNGSSKVTPPCYVRFQFYTSSTRTARLCNSLQIGVPYLRGNQLFGQ
ncbi:MAG: hypothetical protein M5U17_09030 [Ignavibacterium sp.]|nr:hypothetical protein [Ignavibacterium sp.]